MDKNKNIYNLKNVNDIRQSLKNINLCYSSLGLNIKDLKSVCTRYPSNFCRNICIYSLLVLILCILLQYNVIGGVFNYFLGVRCVLRNNYIIWEATRPLSNCEFCKNLSEPIVLQNVSRKEFEYYAYTSKPILIKKAFLHWPARKVFDLQFFKNLYLSINESYTSVDEECQFLHFKSNFISIKDVFNMSELRVKNAQGATSWYVGWGNCHPIILQEMRKYYPKPHFLPDDCEIPSKEYVFMGYDDGATMHLDFINRLMWQAQLKGTKTWNLLPPPECEEICHPLNFVAEPGDAVLADTRVWYHGTKIKNGEFSVSVQSEYG
ncbi:unnamed protein product [Brassicogethes aeneus]|uniref:Uncharacterized protein n=1 Tax=Brassicogethes aeneus TaxID=1431903 RepID=A0A9P0FBV9_BRAAE|nr:unnamed protein product [Brassicogethes aeneus]